VGRADHCADARQASFAYERLPPLVDELCDVLPQHSPVGEGHVLHLGCARIRRAHEEEDARALPPTGGDERLARVVTEVRARGDRVRQGLGGVARLEKRCGVRAGRGGDVATLRVHEHEDADGARVLADLLERANAVRAELLEERALRLDRDDVGADGVDDPLAEPRDGRRGGCAAENGLPAKLDGQQVETRVEPDYELGALALDGLAEPVGEVDVRHGAIVGT
jgi:hypothetical protein